jgi:hypothetical protein
MKENNLTLIDASGQKSVLYVVENLFIFPIMMQK